MYAFGAALYLFFYKEPTKTAEGLLDEKHLEFKVRDLSMFSKRYQTNL